VFFAPLIAGLRVAATWMAGMSRMDWWRFLLWNAAGGMAWATVVGLTGEVLGHAALAVLSRVPWLAAAATLLALIAAGAMAWRRRASDRRG
jgi:membrane protein DedA with SNARE-associated domain